MEKNLDKKQLENVDFSDDLLEVEFEVDDTSAALGFNHCCNSGTTTS